MIIGDISVTFIHLQSSQFFLSNYFEIEQLVFLAFTWFLSWYFVMVFLLNFTAANNG